MRIAFNPSTVAALIAPPNNKDITFDLRGRNIFVNGEQCVKYDGNTEANLNFGDDFINENNNIKVTWGNGTT